MIVRIVLDLKAPNIVIFQFLLHGIFSVEMIITKKIK